MINKLAQFLLLLCISTLSFAEDYINVTNNTGHEVWHIFISPSDNDDWEEDLLDEDETLPNGETMKINLNDYTTKFFDVKMIDEKEQEYEIYDINVKKNDAVFTSENIVKEE